MTEQEYIEDYEKNALFHAERFIDYINNTFGKINAVNKETEVVYIPQSSVHIPYRIVWSGNYTERWFSVYADDQYGTAIFYIWASFRNKLYIKASTISINKIREAIKNLDITD